ncbi:hypothetical protein EV426DRAFT_699595 [Tirmania nivea]|nr:hypothetical protein EV426DRAFT_699595 [Tirmania nivea]
MTYPLHIYFPTILCSKPGITLELASSINLELPDNVPVETWKKLTIIRGRGLSVRMKLRWNDDIIWNDRFMELFGRAVSKSKLWAQLLFSVSLELPGAPDTQDDIILKLTRADINDAAWSPSAVESQIAAHLPNACLSKLNLTAFFSSISRPVVETRLETASKLGVLGTHLPGLSGDLNRETPEGVDEDHHEHKFEEKDIKLGTPVHLLFNDCHTNDLETSNDTQGVESVLWRLVKSRVDDNPGRRNQFNSLLSWGEGVEEILHAITQSFDLSRYPGQENSKVTEENGLLHQTQEQPSRYGNVDSHKMILEQEGPGTPTDDVLDFSQHDLLWLQDWGETPEVCPAVHARDMGIYHQPTLLECDKEILEQSLLSLSEARTVEYKEEEMLL